MEKTYYEILGIEPDADDEEIRHAFRTLARQYHPDSGNETASQQLFQQITEANDILSNAEKRAQYDAKTGIAEKLREQARQQSTSSTRLRKPSRVDLRDLRDRMQAQERETKAPPPEPETSERPSSFMQKLFSKAKPPTEAAQPQAATAKSVENALRGSRQFSFTIDIFESFYGTVREVVLNDRDSGERYSVRIPAGVENNSVHTLEGKGDGLNAIERIEARIYVTPHPYVDRQGLDILLKAPVSFGEALRGTEITVPTVQSSIKVKIPADFAYGSRLRMKGLGLQDPLKKTIGDMYLQPYIVLPDQRGDALNLATEAIEPFYRAAVRREFPRTFRK